DRGRLPRADRRALHGRATRGLRHPRGRRPHVGRRHGEPVTAPQMTFDPRPLTEPVDPAAVRAFAAELRSRQSTGASAATIIGIVAAVVVGVVMVPALVSVVLALSSFGASPAAAAIPVALIVLLLTAVGVMIWLGV